ncbi:hypothetical protein Vafri_14039 [Volvox africanus]|uniref:Mitochondrial splicing suppressor 51-like C-terminal domain-containing protein n=1 Tax=Volvox africanus TaxID=51714 RepID=A0A8J4BDI2_9CHLO|nr:hypothetical protein Vafri_14039 [Volvox africanus]
MPPLLEPLEGPRPQLTAADLTAGAGAGAGAGAICPLDGAAGNAISIASSKAGESGAAAAAAIRTLHVAFVGPELREIILQESEGRTLPQGTSLSVQPPPPGRELLYSYHLCTYQEFATGSRRHQVNRRDGDGGVKGVSKPPDCASWRRPDVAVAFNSGISEHDQKLWEPALKLLIQHRVPVVFTSYNDVEAAADAAVWRAVGGDVTLGPQRNPFRAMEPISEPSQVRVSAAGDDAAR